MRLSSLFEDFCRYLRVEKEAARRTTEAYHSRFNDFMECALAETRAPLLLEHFTVDLCRAYQYQLDRRGAQPNTIRTRLATLSSFGEWLVQRGKLNRNPIRQLTRPKARAYLPRVPRWSLIESLLANGLDLRSKTIVALLACGGLRRSEVVSLNVCDFDPEFGLRRVRGKGGREDAVALPEAACKIVAAYIAQRRSGVDPSAPLFVTRYLSIGGRAREGRMVEGRVYKLIRALGVEGLHPHAFRHACGVELLERSQGDLRSVQEHLRHRDIQTTTIYTRLTKPRLKQIVNLLDIRSDPAHGSGAS